MMDRLGYSFESQIAYWNHEGATKTFTHPVNMDGLQEHLTPEAQILDCGCGYGRVAAMLSEQGYQVIGVDSAAAMIEKALGEMNVAVYVECVCLPLFSRFTFLTPVAPYPPSACCNELDPPPDSP